MRLGLDVSNHTGVPTPAQLAELRAKGYEFCIPGTQTGLDGKCYTLEQIAAFETAGFEVPAVYVFLYWDGRDAARVADAMKYRKPVWIDCEYDRPPNMTPAALVDIIVAAVNQLRDQCAGIYTGGWWWPQTGNASAFNYLPLWDANYTEKPTMAPVSYGGWTKAQIHQYSSKGDAGVNADLNVTEDVPAPTPNPPPSPQPTEVQALRALVRAGAVIAAGDQSLGDLKEEDKQALDWIAATARA